MVMVIKARIDEQGRLVIPKDVREKWNLRGEVEMVEVEGGVLIRPKKRWMGRFSIKKSEG
jgi:AbrB family looped-hinge helix DNA binding protein